MLCDCSWQKCCKCDKNCSETYATFLTDSVDSRRKKLYNDNNCFDIVPLLAKYKMVSFAFEKEKFFEVLFSRADLVLQ